LTRGGLRIGTAARSGAYDKKYKAAFYKEKERKEKCQKKTNKGKEGFSLGKASQKTLED
jgi:hypothetical protein